MPTVLSRQHAQAVLGAIPGLYPDGMEVALLSSMPTASDGVFSLTGKEISSADGYGRQTIDTLDWEVVAGSGNPAVLAFTNDVLFGLNMGSTDWPAVTHAALLNDDDDVLAVISADAPVTIKPNRRLRIPAGALTLRLDCT